MLPDSGLDAFRRGDTKTLSRLYSKYSPIVARALTQGCTIRTTGRPLRVRLGSQDLEIAVQDTFVRAFSQHARATYDGARPFAPWLLAIAKHAMLDLLRSHIHDETRNRDTVRVEELAESLQTPEASPEANVLALEERGLLGQFVAHLPQKERDFAQTRFLDGLTQKDTATLLSLTRAQVRLREAQLRRELAQWLRLLERRGSNRKR